ncbi:unnamed protein product, partial [Ceratitis capitata]
MTMYYESASLSFLRRTIKFEELKNKESPEQLKKYEDQQIDFMALLDGDLRQRGETLPSTTNTLEPCFALYDDQKRTKGMTNLDH